MIKKIIKAVSYYFYSIYQLVIYSSFWKIPLVLISRPQIYRIKNQRFYVWTLLDIWTLKEVILDDCYLANFKNQIDKKLQNVIDIGTGIGDFAIQISPFAKRVYSFDLDKNRITLAKKNLSLNKITNVILQQRKITGLDDLFLEFSLKRCDLLKCDCEGNEYLIFANCKNKNFRKIKLICMEIHLFNEKMITQYRNLKKKLIKNGFTLKEFDNPVHSYLKFLYAVGHDS